MTTDVLGWIVLCCDDTLYAWWDVYVPGLYPLDASSTPDFNLKNKNVSAFQKGPCQGEAKSSLVENHWFRKRGSSA